MENKDELLEELKEVMKAQGKLWRKSKALRKEFIPLCGEYKKVSICELELGKILLHSEKVMAECLISEIESSFVNSFAEEKKNEILDLGDKIIKKYEEA